MKSNITILICLIVLTISCANKPELTWQEIADNNWRDSYFIEEDEVLDRDTLILYLTTGYYYDRQDMPEVQKILKLRDDKVLNEPFDPLLAILYYYHHVNTEEIKDNNELLKVLLKFKDIDKTNALPNYLLSYYYALNKDSDNTIKYLKEGNELSSIELYNKELNKIIFDYYINKTDNEVFSYLITILSTNHISSFLAYYRKYVLSEKINLKHGNKNNRILVSDQDFYKFGKNLHSNSKSHIDLLLATAIELNSIDENETERIDELKKLRRRIYLTSAKLNLYERKGEKEQISFLKDQLEYGETEAYKNFENYDQLLTDEDIKNFCNDWSTKIFHFPDDDKEIKEQEGWVNTFTRVMECRED